MAKNKDLRAAAEKADVKLWEIAQKLGILDSNFSRKLRYELSKKEKLKIRTIINEIVAERRG